MLGTRFAAGLKPRPFKARPEKFSAAC